MIQNNLKLKHKDRFVTNEQDYAISCIQKAKRISYLEAKDIYFNNSLLNNWERD